MLAYHKLYTNWRVVSDLPEGWTNELAKFNKEILHAISEADQLLTRNKIFDRTKDVGIISKEEAIDFGLSGPNLRAVKLSMIFVRRNLFGL